MRVENAAWVQVARQPTETHAIGPLDGPMYASFHRLQPGSICWQWNFLRDSHPFTGIFVAEDFHDVREHVEQMLVNAGLARFRNPLLG